MIVQVDRPDSVIGALIKRYTDGPDNHSMLLIGNGQVATQGWLYRLESISLWRDCNMTVWYSPKWTAAGRDRALAYVNGKLAKPWYKRRYDFLGVLGQRLGISRLNIPYIQYCSEDVAAALHLLNPEYQEKHPSPNQLRKWFLEDPDMHVYGRYERWPLYEGEYFNENEREMI